LEEFFTFSNYSIMEGMSKDCSLRYQKEFDLGLKVEWKAELSLRWKVEHSLGFHPGQKVEPSLGWEVEPCQGLQDLGQKVELSLGQKAETFQRFFKRLCRMWSCL
jgi:hypothetical protein